VIEDDAIFNPHSALLLKKFMEQVPGDWQQLFLGGQHLDLPEDVPYRPMVMRGKNVTRTHAFALRNTGYDIFQQHIANAVDYLANGGWHVDHQIGAAHQKELWKTYVPSWWISGQGPGDSNIANKTNPSLWWHPPRYASHLPFVYHRIDGADSKMLRQTVHFGNHPVGSSFVDEGLTRCVGSASELKKWLDEIADESLSMGKLPGVCHPEISLESVAEIWSNWVIESTDADLEKMADYPFNGLFRHPVNRMRLRPIAEFQREAVPLGDV
jgi:hypothetical protein